MKLPIFMLIISCCLIATINAQQGQRNEKSNNAAELPPNGSPVIEEVVVESSLHIKQKQRTNVRRVRRSGVLPEALFAEHKRIKRQFGGGRRGGGGVQAGVNAGAGVNGFGSQAGTNVGAGPNGATAGANADNFGSLAPGQIGQSQAAANGAAHHNYNNGAFDFGNSAANAIAQGFQSQGANGNGFGATSAGTVTQNTQGGLAGLQNSAGASHSQTFRLPNGQTINFAATNSFANGPLGNNANSRGGAVSVSG